MKKLETTEIYPILLKTVSLTPAECERYRKSFRINTRVRESIVDILISAQAELVERENEVWQELSQKFGDKSHEELLREGKCVSIAWDTGIVTLRSDGKGGKVEEELP